MFSSSVQKKMSGHKENKKCKARAQNKHVTTKVGCKVRFFIDVLIPAFDHPNGQHAIVFYEDGKLWF